MNRYIRIVVIEACVLGPVVSTVLLVNVCLEQNRNILASFDVDDKGYLGYHTAFRSAMHVPNKARATNTGIDGESSRLVVEC